MNLSVYEMLEKEKRMLANRRGKSIFTTSAAPILDVKIRGLSLDFVTFDEMANIGPAKDAYPPGTRVKVVRDYQERFNHKDGWWVAA